jgi:hypothetical protein
MLMGLQFAYGTPFWNPIGAPLGAPGRRPIASKGGIRNRRGLGQTCLVWNYDPDTGDPVSCAEYDDSTPISPVTGGTCPGSPGCPGYVPPAPAGSSSGSSPSTSPSVWTNIIASLSADASNLYKAVAGPVPAGCTVVTQPNGSQIQSCSASGIAPAISNLLQGNNSVWLLGGLALVLVLLDEKH